MAIVNCTPDSFFPGSRTPDHGQAVRRAERCVEEGAQILDLGAESTRPGADPVSEEEEWARLEAVLRVVCSWQVAISVDTRRPSVMRRALDMGADIINDVQALTAAGAVEVLRAYPSAGACLMHMRGEPGTMQSLAEYEDVVSAVRGALQDRLERVQSQGIAPDRLVLDPGIGFAKTAEQNWSLLARQAELLSVGRPLLVGWSRKSALGQVTGRAVDERLPASLAAAVLALERGASILRVHDVAATLDAVRVWQAVRSPMEPATIPG